MTFRTHRWLGAALLVIAAALVASCGNGTQQDAARNRTGTRTITIGWTSWADARFMAQLVKQQIESRTNLEVHLQKLAIGVQYQAVANGDIDGMVMAWLPDTHKNYWKKVHADVVDLGPMYRGAVVGWAVPDYVPDNIRSIADLGDAQAATLFHGVIEGIDPGAGEMRESRQAIKAYGLTGKYQLKVGSEKSMIAALAQAERDRKPIVVTLWTPHWAFGKWHLRFLKDPKHAFAGAQHVDAVVRKGFRRDYPRAAGFLTHLHIPLGELQKAMYVAHQQPGGQKVNTPIHRLHTVMNGASVVNEIDDKAEKAAVVRFVKTHRTLVDSWWKGDRAASGNAARSAQK